MLELQIIEDLSELSADTSRWDAVAGDYPLFRWNWMGTWWEHLGGQRRPWVVVACDRETGQWRGLAPLAIDSSSPLGTRLCWWGSGAACTDYLRLMGPPEIMPEFSLALADLLDQHMRPGGALARVDLLELDGADLTDAANIALLQALEACGFTAHQTPLEGCWVADLPADRPALLQAVSKSMRRKVKKAIQRLDEATTAVRHAGNTEFDWLWSRFVELHQQRRQMLGQEGCFADPAFERFLKAAASQFVSQGNANLLVIESDQQPLACGLLFHGQGTSYLYQAGSDATRMHLEPGYQIVLAAFEAANAQSSQRFDFMRGDEPYKSRWLTERVPLHRVRLVPRKWSARVKHNLWLTGRTLKNYLRPAVS